MPGRGERAEGASRLYPYPYLTGLSTIKVRIAKLSPTTHDVQGVVDALQKQYPDHLGSDVVNILQVRRVVLIVLRTKSSGRLPTPDPERYTPDCTSLYSAATTVANVDLVLRLSSIWSLFSYAWYTVRCRIAYLFDSPRKHQNRNSPGITLQFYIYAGILDSSFSRPRASERPPPPPPVSGERWALHGVFLCSTACSAL